MSRPVLDVVQDAGTGDRKGRPYVAGANAAVAGNLEEDTLYFVRVTAGLDRSYGYAPSRIFSVVTLAQQRPFMRGWRLGIPRRRPTTDTRPR